MANLDFYGLFDFASGDSDIYQYTSAELSDILGSITGDGIVKDYLNMLEPTLYGYTVSVDTGAVILGGRFGKNSSSKTFTIDVETSGNKRIDIIVVRCNIPNRVIGIEKIVGTSTTGTPTEPSVNYTADVKEIILARLDINGSTVTITDRRSNWIKRNQNAVQDASEILTKVKTVDGSGSGLDADTLDGNEATAFATAAQGTKADGALQRNSGGWVKGTLILGNSQLYPLIIQDTRGRYLGLRFTGEQWIADLVSAPTE
jgi:hypothetical protein